MAPTRPGLPPAFAPSQQLIALALIIVRTKPVGISARDYVLQLRSQLRIERQDWSEPERSRYLDLVTYWQQRFKEAENKCSELENKVVELERTSNLLDGLSRVNDEGTTSSAKRKGKSSTTVRTKRVKTSESISAEAIMEDDFNSLKELGEYGMTLTKYMWMFQKLFRQPEGDPQAICSSLIGIAGALGHTISTIARCHGRLTTRTKSSLGLSGLGQDKTEFTCSLSACGRAFSMVLMGLNSLNDDNLGRRLPGLVVCECVQMFSTALDAIEASARQSAADSTASTSKSKGSRTASTPPLECASARGVAHFLAGLIGYLEKNNPAHQQLFDGFAYVLFERVGKRLFYCTFGRHRSATVEGDILPIPKPARSLKLAQQAPEALAIRYEVKALIILLERTMGLAPNHMNPQPAKKNPARLSRALSLKRLCTSKMGLSTFAKDRLQRTLITCMFGEKPDDDFLEVLTMPVRLGPVPNIPKIEDKDVDEWYQKEVWRLVGWDILARESGWFKNAT